MGFGGGLADVRPADGGRWVVKVRTMIDRSWPPGSADVPVGSHFELVTHGDLVLPGVTQPAQTSCKMGIPLAMWLRTFGAGVPA